MCVHMEIREERKGRDGTYHPTTPGTPRLNGPWSSRRRNIVGNSKKIKPEVFASTAACKKQWIIASLDINMAFLRGLTYQELAEATGEKERVVCIILPPGSATVLRSLPGFENYDESKHCLQCLKPGTGTKDAPRAFSLKLRRNARGFGLRPTSYDEEFEASNDLLTAKHVYNITMAGTEDTIDKCVKCVEDTFDESVKQLRPIQHPELTGAGADARATEMGAD
eukprot:4883929-Pyramimonas_sp.AAC.1